MDKTITLILQLSLVIPFVMLIVAALVGFRILKGNPRWPTFIGVLLTSVMAIVSLFFFRSTIQSRSYSQTLIQWISLSNTPEANLQIGVLFDPLSLSFYLLISLASLFYLLLDDSSRSKVASSAKSTFSPLLFLLCFFASSGIVLATNFLQLLMFWFALSMGMNLLHELHFESASPLEEQRRHWWGWNAFSDVMLLLAIFLISTNFESLDFISCLNVEAIQKVQIKNSAALPGIGATLFFAAMPRLGLFPASMLIISKPGSWRSSSLTALSLLAIPVGLFLLLRCTLIFLAIGSNQSLLMQLGTVSALLTLLSALTRVQGSYRDQFLYWMSATMAGIAVAMLGMNPRYALHFILPMILLQTCVMAVLIPLTIRLQTGNLPMKFLASLKVCVLLLMISGMFSLGYLLNPLVTVRNLATDFRTELMVWLIPLVAGGFVFGGTRFYFSLFTRYQSVEHPEKFLILPVLGITIFISLMSAALYLPIPFFQQLWFGLIADNQLNPFDRDWFFCSLSTLIIIVSLILAWMTSPQQNLSKSPAGPQSALIQLGHSHYYSLNILKRTLIDPLELLVKSLSLLDEWLISRFSRATLEKTPLHWGNLLQQMQNGQIAFQTLILLFTLSVLIFVLMVLQI